MYTKVPFLNCHLMLMYIQQAGQFRRVFGIVTNEEDYCNTTRCAATTTTMSNRIALYSQFCVCRYLLSFGCKLN